MSKFKKINEILTLELELTEAEILINLVEQLLELLGERLTDNAESATAWACAEWLREYGERLEHLTEDIMAIQRIEADKPKGKKK